jgi:uncharacterized protein
MMHPHTRLDFVSEEIGIGVFATQFIPKGTVVWVLDDLDRKFDENYVNSLDPLRQKYIFKHAYRDREGKYILCWDIAQFVNHSFRANCISTAYNLEIAVRDIYPGEQLTDDYGCFNLDEPFNCLPEEGIVRTRVMPDDILTYHQEWDSQVAQVIPYFNRVEQPLKHFIEEHYLARINAVVEQKIPLDSMLTIYYDRNKKRDLNLQSN